MRVLICAGGTGGGIYPALAAATELQALGVEQNDILWIGTKGEMEETLVTRAGLRLETIAGGPIAGVPVATRARNLAKLAQGYRAASNSIGRFRPNVMFMTGGYVAAPVSLAARRHKVPIVIYLPDVEPGSSIRLAIPMARRIACTTDGSRQFVPAEKMVVTGYPVRPDIRAAGSLSKAEALGHFDLKPGRPTLFVFGGSRGARNINRALMGALPDLLQEAQIIHVSGTLTWPEVKANAANLPAELHAWYRPFPYLHEEMGAAFRAADLTLARAGASMMGECPAFGLPSILVPLTFAWRYQKVNADYLTERGAAVQLVDETLTESLLPTVRELLFNPERLSRMAAAAKTLDRPNAAADLAQVILAESTSSPQKNSSLAHEEAPC
ncbi:MAG: UDP-N-acetylglucosamine--N-acetylmuramyl-(pentapeptide) pyrophosphoryl-undecaprenol N-acetylglucosamine transferase [Candidatus Promineofilum sp.]|nr:UDP-N-acetylglucosamine--N-acetylmuramyl-(pentapeptide) pyrophosphoryl-undecaprenol N-acetylglucosamine transferase [Promineifilum sp.]MBP9656902.1 UDP-N-acetylglucosamine--N-acetylmuramyl-(pentapeptide) pyrophosphoryl-undecaprenol N-acetylglucosamine transferase [Promineifilum sp.]